MKKYLVPCAALLVLVVCLISPPGAAQQAPSESRAAPPGAVPPGNAVRPGNTGARDPDERSRFMRPDRGGMRKRLGQAGEEIPPGSPRAQGRFAEDAVKMRRNARDMMQQARERMLNMSPEAREAMRKQHRDTRESRRTAKVSRMRTRWGQLLENPAVQEEMRQHARRMARLHRIQSLAEDTGKGASLERVLDLMRREQRRHIRTMHQFRRAAGLGRPTNMPAPGAAASEPPAQPEAEDPHADEAQNEEPAP